MSVEDEISNIKPQKLASDMPKTFNGTILALRRDTKKGAYAGAPLVKIEILVDDGQTFTTSYRIPKVWTGKGQMDKFISNLKGMGLTISECVGKTFQWQIEELEGSMKGMDRHYPIKLLKQTKLRERIQ